MLIIVIANAVKGLAMLVFLGAKNVEISMGDVATTKDQTKFIMNNIELIDRYAGTTLWLIL
ncbi:MAG: hypothetical protein IPP74_13600 [Alphaproteobacteria bacterium]|nr:hypothetical protein [Alphaproteobacteria bacterium]